MNRVSPLHISRSSIYSSSVSFYSYLGIYRTLMYNSIYRLQAIEKELPLVMVDKVQKQLEEQLIGRTVDRIEISRLYSTSSTIGSIKLFFDNGYSIEFITNSDEDSVTPLRPM